MNCYENGLTISLIVYYVIRDRPKLFQIIFDFNPPPNSIEQGLTNRLVPKVSKNSTKNLVKINREVNWFRKMQF